jgi:large subunit ribosomal protein L18
MRKVVLRKRDKLRIKRKRRVRGYTFGVVEIPRVTIYKSNRYLYAQAIDDSNGKTLAHSDGAKLKIASNKEGAKALALDFAAKLKSAKIDKIIFDRNGYKYHGTVQVFADTLRENEIKF